MTDLVIKENKGIKFLQFKRLLDLGIDHGFYLGKDLNFRTFDALGPHPENFVNYEIFINALGMDYRNSIKANQNHTNNVLVVNDKVNSDKPDLNLEKYDDIDGLITNNSDLILGTTAADCNLIYLYDPVKKVIGNIHSGWKGTLNSIIRVAIREMMDKFKVDPNNLIACINPSIRVCHFEVGDEVYELFKNKFQDKKYYTFMNKKWHIDLVEILIDELLDEGLRKGNIIDSKICTYCNGDIHSYRRDKENFGLTLAAIKLEGEGK